MLHLKQKVRLLIANKQNMNYYFPHSPGKPDQSFCFAADSTKKKTTIYLYYQIIYYTFIINSIELNWGKNHIVSDITNLSELCAVKLLYCSKGIFS